MTKFNSEKAGWWTVLSVIAFFIIDAIVNTKVERK